VDFPGHELELDFMQRPYAGKALVEPFDGNERGHGADRVTNARPPQPSSREAGGKGAKRRKLS
jgi:hypothetical protein